jgi:hypothetical protein
MHRLKERAAKSDTSVSRIVEQAVHGFLSAPRGSAAAARFELVTYGLGGRFSGHNIDKTASLLEADDIERFGRQS